ncbi:hypothetical protein EWM64_g10251, partial [Hericium alpestre]
MSDDKRKPRVDDEEDVDDLD